MTITEIISMNNWLERMVVGVLEVIARPNLENHKIGQESMFGEDHMVFLGERRGVSRHLQGIKGKEGGEAIEMFLQ